MPMSPRGGSPTLVVRKSSGTYTPTGFGTMSLPSVSLFRGSNIIAVLFMSAVLTCGAALVAQQQEEEVPFLYPDPRTVGVHPYIMQGRPAGAVTPDRYAGISEQERQERILWEQHMQKLGLQVPEQPLCPLCVDDPMTPCKRCRLCEAGFPCEKTLCRHCVQPRSKNMSSACDLTAGDEPCGTCDSCREHRSDPCEHADTGYGPRGEYNPHREPRFLSVIPRPILDWHNNGARKFPVYYNPAPYYRPTWNPSTFAGYARPFTFRWSCGLCFRDPCGCDTPGLAGQVSYAYTCKFCNRNPCACTQDICNVTKALDPIGIAQALAEMNEEAAGPRPVEITGTSPATTPNVPPGGGIQVDSLLDDDDSTVVPEADGPVRQRPLLDTPTPATPPPAGSATMS